VSEFAFKEKVKVKIFVFDIRGKSEDEFGDGAPDVILVKVIDFAVTVNINKPEVTRLGL